MTTQTIEQTITDWSENPDKALAAPAVTARSDGAQAVIEAGPFSLRADLGPPLGGTNQAPSPTALLLAALAGCAVVFVRDTLAPQLGVEVETVEAKVHCESDMRGLLGLDGAEPDLRGISVEVNVSSPDGAEAVTELARIWKERCPIFLAVKNPNEVSVQFTAA